MTVPANQQFAFDVNPSEPGTTTYKCDFDGETAFDCETQTGYSHPGGLATDAPHSFSVVATDAALNTATIVRSVEVSPVPPDMSFVRPPTPQDNAATDGAPTFVFSDATNQLGTTYDCQVDALASFPCDVGATITPPNGLSQGSHSFTVVGTGTGGSQSIVSHVIVNPPPARALCQTSSSLTTLIDDASGDVVAYIPRGSWTDEASRGIDVANVEGSSIAGGGVSIPTVNAVNSCAANALTRQVVCTANNTDVYRIVGTELVASLTSSASGSVLLTGGDCTNCGLVVDATHNKALLEISYASRVGGFQYLDLDTNTFEPAFASRAPQGNSEVAIAQSIGLDIIRNLVTSANMNGNYELIDVTYPPVPIFYELQATHKPTEATAEDCVTGLSLSPALFESPSQVFISDLTQAVFTSSQPVGSWSSAGQLQTLSESVLYDGANDVAIAQGTHTGVLSGAFDGQAITAVAMPNSSGSGTPAIQDWMTCSVPASTGFVMGRDPQTLTAYRAPQAATHGNMTVNGGDAIALLVNGAPYSILAVVDLTKLLDPQIVARTAGGHACAAGTMPDTVVRFITLPQPP